MIRNILCLFLFLVSYLSYGVPARPIPFIVYQPDGTKLELSIIGDERFHYYVTEDGIPLLQINDNEKSSYHYAIVKDEVLIPSDILAHSEKERSFTEKQFINNNKKSVLDLILKKRTQAKQRRVQEMTRSVADSFGNISYSGKRRGLVILVNFADKAMYGENPQSTINRQFNECGYNLNGHVGSVHDYFSDQSYGRFDLTFDVVGPITLSHEMAYYGANDIATGRNDIRIGKLVSEACSLIDDYVNFSVYDWNNDGEVEQIFIIYAGYGEASGGSAYTIWPHEFSLTGCSYFGDGKGPIILDNVTIDTYACSCELSGSSGNTLNGIGTACHEFSHCLGLPDLYDVDYSGAFGMDRWDVMDSGSYSGPTGNGEIPYGYSAFEKAYVGWLDLIELDEEKKCNLPSLEKFPIAYKITNRGNENEYFILENHQTEKWYSYVSNYNAPHGMMISHIDYNKLSWKNNIVNTYPTHMRESIIPADKNYGTFIPEIKRYHVSEEDFKGDLFPGIKNITRMSSISHENCGGILFNQNSDGTFYMDMVIDNISEKNGIISFTVGNAITVPDNISASYYDGVLNVKWEEVPNANRYSVQVLKIFSLSPYKIETLTIDDINETSLCLEDIKCKTCNVKIIAKNDYASSEWSEYIKAIEDPDGINDIIQEENLLTECYYINGIITKNPRKRGIYIQKENNQTKKIYIR